MGKARGRASAEGLGLRRGFPEHLNKCIREEKRENIYFSVSKWFG